MADCRFPLPCESTISSNDTALTITNNGNGTVITAIANGDDPDLSRPALTARSINNSGILANSDFDDGVRALSGSKRGVFASSGNFSGFSVEASGVWGDSRDSRGVVGSSDTEAGVFGRSRTDPGVIGESEGQGAGNFGVVGSCIPGTGVIGISGSGLGVNGVSTTNNGVGVSGTAMQFGTGVIGNGNVGVTGNGNVGVMGNINSLRFGAGVVGNAGGTNSRGIVGNAGGFLSLAGLFNGNVNITGTLSKGGGGFKIDHPLDSANKYLNHSFVESPEMKNLYDGIAILDDKGETSVELPEYFESLNRDFCYQLTSIGVSAPNLYIAEEVSHNRFKIAGGKPGMRVSWQITGIRHDPWAEANPLIVEEDKPEIQQGYYLHPELYDQPEERGLEWAVNPELMRQMKEEQQNQASTSMRNQIEEQVRYLREKMDRHREQQQDSSST